MKMLRLWIAGLLLLVLFKINLASDFDVISSGIIIKNVNRSIDLASQLVKISHKITLQNSGNDVVRSFLFAVETKFRNSLSYIGAQTGDSSKSPLKILETEVRDHTDKIFFKIELRNALKPGDTVYILVEIIYTHLLQPYPANIAQREKQRVLYHGNDYLFSPYPVEKQTTTVSLNSVFVESHSNLEHATQSQNNIVYKPYENAPPFLINPMTIHYENNAPFLTITNLERVIEVSHWGKIAVEETIELKHNGAVLKGPFSRYEYQTEAQSGLSSIKSFKTIIPASATDAYYRDNIGNISTSHMKMLHDSVELDLRLRFPLFGGWKINYVVGYNVPTFEYLYNAGEYYLLKMRILDHVFDDMVVDQLTTKIILPEGSEDIHLTTPYSVDQLPNSIHYTYLDTTGRPVIVFRKNNLVENHIKDFELQYHFPRVLMFQEPLLVILAFYLLFLGVIVYVRLDFSITKDGTRKNPMKVVAICERILAHQDRRALTYTHYEEELAKLKSSKDISAFLSIMKNISQEYKTETAYIDNLLVKLKAQAPDLTKKVVELQKTDRHLKELYTQHQSLYLDKLVPGKVTHLQFVDMEDHLKKKKEECVEKIIAIVKSLQ